MSTDARGQDKTTVLSTDNKHSLLSNQRRRRVIALLDQHGTLTKGELADKIAPMEIDCSPVTSQERKRVVVALHQVHLPKLEDYGVVEHRPDGYQLGPAAHELIPMIDELPRFRRASTFVKTAMGRY